MVSISIGCFRCTRMCLHQAQKMFRSPRLCLGHEVCVGTHLCRQYVCFSLASKGSLTTFQSKHWSGSCQVCLTCSTAPGLHLLILIQFSTRYWLKPPSKNEAKGNINRWYTKKQSTIIHRVFIVTITDVKRPSSLLEAVECLETASLLQGFCTCMFSEVCTQFPEKPAYWTMKRRFVLHLGMHDCSVWEGLYNSRNV